MRHLADETAVRGTTTAMYAAASVIRYDTRDVAFGSDDEIDGCPAGFDSRAMTKCHCLLSKYVSVDSLLSLTETVQSKWYRVTFYWSVVRLPPAAQ